MRIVSSYHARDLSKKWRWQATETNSILLFAIYVSGLIAGCLLYIGVRPLREAAQHILVDQFLSSMSFTGMVSVTAVITLGISIAVFGSGLSLIGYLYIYVCPFCIGTITGLFYISVYGTSLPMSVVKCVLLQPACGAFLCADLCMCSYASEMSACLIKGKGSREVTEEKKYILRIILLTAGAIAFNIVFALTVVLLRHVR